MLHKEERKIIELYRLDPFAELTLQEVMQKLGKKSYNWTYLAIQKLSKRNILVTKRIGRTIVAKINFDSEDAITELIHSERKKAEKKPKELQEIKKQTPFFVYLQNSKSTIVIADKEIKIKGLQILSKEEFVKQLTAPEANAAKQMVRDHLILHGAEIYYEILLEAYRRGLR